MGQLGTQTTDAKRKRRKRRERECVRTKGWSETIFPLSFLSFLCFSFFLISHLSSFSIRSTHPSSCVPVSAKGRFLPPPLLLFGGMIFGSLPLLRRRKEIILYETNEGSPLSSLSLGRSLLPTVYKVVGLFLRRWKLPGVGFTHYLIGKSTECD